MIAFVQCLDLSTKKKKTKTAMKFLGKRRRRAMIEFSKTTRGRKKGRKALVAGDGRRV
jgi:hypothetical protein